MCTFIQNYLDDPAQAISEACGLARRISWFDEIDDEQIYKEIASPEFRLYEEMVMADAEESTPHVSGLAVVA